MTETNQFKIQFASVPQATYPNSTFIEVKAKNGQFISWGATNTTPVEYNTLYEDCSLHSGIVNKKINYIYGNGLYSESGNATIEGFVKNCNSKGDSLDDIALRCVEDYCKFGGFAVEIINNRLGELQDVYYIDQSNLRISGSEDKILYSKEWCKQYGKIKPTIYNVYTPGQSGSATSIYWYKGTSRGYYPTPEYRGGLMGIKQLTELDKLGLNYITNGFFPSLMIAIPDGAGLTEEQKEAIQNSMLEKWGGTSNSGKVMLTFPDPQSPPPTIQAIEQPDVVNQFNQQRQNAIDSVYYGHQVSVRNIFGTQTPGKLGLSKDYQEGTEVFVKDYVTPAQKKIMKVFNRLLSVKFPDCDLALKPVEPIGSTFEDENLLASAMTVEEFRQNVLLDQGLITEIEIPEGAKMMTTSDNKSTTTDKEDLPKPEENAN